MGLQLVGSLYHAGTERVSGIRFQSQEKPGRAAGGTPEQAVAFPDGCYSAWRQPLGSRGPRESTSIHL